MVTWRHTSPLYKHWYRLITVEPRLRSLKRGLVSRFFSIHYTVTGAENIVRYIEVPLYDRERKIGLTPLPRFWLLSQFAHSHQQEGILYTHASIWAVEGPQRHFLWIVYVQYQHLQAVFWSWMTCIGCYVPQTCSLRYRGISTMKVSLLYLRCRPWEDSLSFRKTVHRRQDGGWMFLPPNISRTFFEQEEKVSMIVFR